MQPPGRRPADDDRPEVGGRAPSRGRGYLRGNSGQEQDRQEQMRSCRLAHSFEMTLEGTGCTCDP